MRTARLVAMAIVIGWALANAVQRVGDWSLSDMDAYWNAALRLRAGEPLYPPVTDPAAVDIYKYSPWFAWLWVPLSFLPKVVVGIGWSAILLAASAVTTLAVAGRRPTPASVTASALLGSILIWSAASGNVQPLLVAALVWSVQARSGPLWIGAAASLKLFPILFAVVYVGQRQFGRAAVAVAAAALLWLPVLMYDLSNYQSGYLDTPSPLLAIHPVLYGAAAAVAVSAAMLLARSRYAWTAAATAVFIALPRVSLIDLTYLSVGAVGNRREAPRS